MQAPATPSVRRGAVLACLVILAAGYLAVFGRTASAQENPPPDGLFVTVPNPISDAAVTSIRERIDSAIIRNNRKIGTVIFDFNPNGQPAGTLDFGSCHTLAQFIRDLAGNGVEPRYGQINTVAFVHNEVSRHTVLPVLACLTIAMSSDTDPGTGQPRARLGDVQRELKGRFTSTMDDAYRTIPKVSPDLVQRMIHKDLPLQAVSYQDKGNPVTAYLSEKHYKSLTKRLAEQGTKWVDLELPPGLQIGNAMFDAVLGEKVNLCTIKDTRQDLILAFNLPRKSLTEDWHTTYVPWRIDLRGKIDKGKLDSLERRARAAIGKGANFIILQLEGDGGDITHAASTAELLRTLKDANDIPVKTVAFVPPGQKLGAATFLALGCGEIVMGPNSVLADFSYLKDEELASVSQMLLPLAREQGYPPLLFEACLNKNLILYKVRPPAVLTDLQLVTEEDFRRDEKAKPPRWVSLGRLDRPAGTLLKINNQLASEFRIAVPVAQPPQDYNAVYSHYGLDPSKVRVSRDDWLDHVAEFFRSPLVNFLLIMFGIIGLIMELKLPGTTVPGVIAAICFVLFFWAYSFVGEFTLLAVLLFLLGLILIGIEVFVVPGFAFPGIAGLVLILSSLALVTLDRMPQTSQEWFGVGTTIGMFALSLAAALAGVFVLAYYLPSIPYANRLVLQPPVEEGDDRFDGTGRLPADAALLGAIGVAATPLRPAGKAQFGDDFLDVIAEGDYVSPGSRVQVIELEGNRIVVKEI